MNQKFVKNNNYLFNYLTVVDFLYYDKAFYGTNFFKSQNPDLQVARKYI